MTTREAIVAEARRWLDTRWLHQGRVMGVGIDCIGLVHEVGKAVGLVADVVIPPYGPRPANGLMRRLCEQHLIRAYEPEIGRIALMCFYIEPQHMGIIGDYPYGGFSLIHSYAKARKAEEHRLDEMWQRNVVAYYDFPGVA